MKPSTHGPVRRASNFAFGKTPPPICIFGEDSTLVPDSCHADEMFDSFILDRFGKSALHFAAIDGDIDQVERLLDLSPHLVGILDSEGKTALHYAVVNGHEQVVEELLDANPILIRGVDAGGMNALHYAVDSGHGDIVALLLEESPELITTVDACGWSALHFAASKGFEAIVTQLLDISPSLAQACDRRGKIALHLAANNGHGKVVKALISASPTTAVDWQGSTALHCAAKKGRKAIITTLLAWNLDMVCSRDRDGNTPLHLAVRAGDVRKSVLTLLYERGPSTLHMVNKQLQSPFHVAVAEENDIAIRSFQQKLSVDEILSAVTMYDKKDYYLTRFKLALLTPCKSLEEWLNEDVANIVYRYVFATPRYHIHLPPNNGTLLDSEE